MTLRPINRFLLFAAMASSAAVAHADASDNPAPGALFDLSHWWLTLPVDANGNPSGSAQTMRQDQISGSNGYKSRYFYTSSGGGMVLMAPANGATTTPGQGSDHVRSELREDANSSHYWTNAQGGQMSATVKVHAVNATQRATVGQIHSKDGILLLMKYDAVSKSLSACVYQTPTSAKCPEKQVASGIAIDQKYDFTIIWVKQQLAVTVNGQKTSFTTDPSWDGTGVYFKIGAYSPAPDSGNDPKDRTTVVVYKLAVSH